MIRTIDFQFAGTSFVIAFQTEADGDRFRAFVEAYERECTPQDWSTVYRLDPQWSVGQYEHVPRYAVWAVDPQAIQTMVNELYAHRCGGTLKPVGPKITVGGSAKIGLTFEIVDMPPPRFSKN